jgi:hypothetical protein
LILPLLALAACQQAAPPAPAPSAEASASAAPAPPPAAPAAKPRAVSEKTELYEFKYSYPAAAAAIPALRDWLEANLVRGRGDLASEAREGKEDATIGEYIYAPYMASTEWKVVTDLPGWLSLSAQVYSFSGGAHGNSAFDTVLWDKAANEKRTAADLFTSSAALKAAVVKAFCAELDRQRAKKRGGEDSGDPSDEFNQCIDPTEQVVILGSKGGKGFDRIGFLIAPYNAGSYAEGSYEVTLPVTAAVLGAVKGEYKSAFVAP